MLNSALILVAEDQPFVALDLAMAVIAAGGQVMGPAASVKDAMDLIDSGQPLGAILDVNLSDGDISPVAERLLGQGVPIIVQTGVGLPAGLAARFPNLPVYLKPCDAEAVVSHLGALIAARQDRA